MATTPESEFRELDRRTNDGIDVRLLWNSHTNRVSVTVKDERSGESFEFEIDSADALAGFHHPFAHAQPARPPGAMLAWLAGGHGEADDIDARAGKRQ
ncbi:MAG TPA: hypothetical protein VF752_03660 [Thermoleophilaceae bacterium]